MILHPALVVNYHKSPKHPRQHWTVVFRMQQVAMLLEFPRCHLSKSHHTASSLSLICMKSKLIVSHYPRPLKQKVPGTDDKGPLFQTLQTARPPDRHHHRIRARDSRASHLIAEWVVGFISRAYRLSGMWKPLSDHKYI